jgi:hypothetical protein
MIVVVGIIGIRVKKITNKIKKVLHKKNFPIIIITEQRSVIIN